MENLDRDERFHQLEDKLRKLADPFMMVLVEDIVDALLTDDEMFVEPTSDVMNEAIARQFGATLKVHHVMSREPFTKDKFEFALARVLRAHGRDAHKMPYGNPGQDLEVDGEPWSLKSQADKSIKVDRLYISKYMELGKGKWEDEDDLYGLRDSMFRHMEAYDRIFSLRCLKRQAAKPGEPQEFRYELVEIPKDLLLRAKDYRCEMMHDSRQTPKPGYCYVEGPDGNPAFALYFDGGTERKLQVKNLEKRYCTVHADWRFKVQSR